LRIVRRDAGGGCAGSSPSTFARRYLGATWARRIHAFVQRSLAACIDKRASIY
jgi:hypothetical protein